MLKSIIAGVMVCVAGQAMAQCGEVERPVTNMIAIPYNQSFGVVGTAAPLPAGSYHFCANYGLKANPGTNLDNYHADIGTDPNNIDTAPAGGSSNGHHIPIPGDPNELTFVEPTGCRNIVLDGSTNVYLHVITAYDPSNASVLGMGALNYCKIN